MPLPSNWRLGETISVGLEHNFTITSWTTQGDFEDIEIVDMCYGNECSRETSPIGNSTCLYGGVLQYLMQR